MQKFRLAVPALILALVLAACGTASPSAAGGNVPDGNGSIVVTSLWGGAEETAFQAVLDAFTAKTGITATYEANRTDYATVLRTRITGGNPPDVAIIPGIGTLRSLARDGSLVSMADLGISQSSIEGNYAPGILDVGVVDNELYGIMVKLNSKATIWYSPDRFSAMNVSAPAATWDDLLKLTSDIKATGATPWSVAAGDSWNLTDRFEELYLKRTGLRRTTSSSARTAIGPTQRCRQPSTRCMSSSPTATSTAVLTALSQPLHRRHHPGLRHESVSRAVLRGWLRRRHRNGADVNTALKGGGHRIDWFDFPTFGGNGAGLAPTAATRSRRCDKDKGVKELHPVHDHSRGGPDVGEDRDDHLAHQGGGDERLPERPSQEGGSPGDGRHGGRSTTDPTCCPAPTWGDAAVCDPGKDMGPVLIRVPDRGSAAWAGEK